MGASSESPKSGYRVEKLYKDSPASALPVEPMLDFVIYPSSSDPAEQAIPFNKFILQNENKEIELTFYNIASQAFWKGKIVPCKWSGKGLLGMSINFDDYTTAHARVLRVLNFFVNSPLHKAGLRSKTDYILGTENKQFGDLDEFTSFIKENNKQNVELYVYNSEEEKMRTVILVPDKEWGGSGFLGGDIASGHLHSLPMRKEKTEKEVAKISEQVARMEVSKEPVEVKQEEKKEQGKMVEETKENVKKEEEEKASEVLGVNETDILLGQKKIEETKKEATGSVGFKGEIII